MRKLVAALLGSVALCAAAMPAAAQSYNWTGVYAGLNAGWQSSDVTWTWTNPAVTTGKETPGPSGGIFGGHLGVQQQFGQFVLGAEIGYSGTGVFGNGFEGGACKVNPAFTCDAKLHSLFTVGPRIGWTPGNNWMVFVTGGYANGQLRTRNNLIATGALFEHTSVSQDGWFLGAGLEFALTKNIILGAEYQRVSLNSALHINAVTAGDNRNVEGDIDVIRARLTFKLGPDPEAPRSLK